jgi:hypothetical protein
MHCYVSLIVGTYIPFMAGATLCENAQFCKIVGHLVFESSVLYCTTWIL